MAYAYENFGLQQLLSYALLLRHWSAYIRSLRIKLIGVIFVL